MNNYNFPITCKLKKKKKKLRYQQSYREQVDVNYFTLQSLLHFDSFLSAICFSKFIANDLFQNYYQID